MNKPVAWIDEETGCFVYSQYDYEDLDEHGKDGLIPLYTHPVKELKNIVVASATCSCGKVMEVTNLQPVKKLTDEEIIKTMVQFDVYSNDDQCLIEAGRAILRKAQEK